jgi:hypothetical protein
MVEDVHGLASDDALATGDRNLNYFFFEIGTCPPPIQFEAEDCWSCSLGDWVQPKTDCRAGRARKRKKITLLHQTSFSEITTPLTKSCPKPRVRVSTALAPHEEDLEGGDPIVLSSCVAL